MDALVTDFSAAGTQVRQAGTFDATPLPGQGVLLCLGAEEVRVYSFPTEEARAAAVRAIDPIDPSHIGTSIVEWAGNPRFWQSGSLVVLYLGGDAATEALLTAQLGPPFAKGIGRGLGGPRLDACGST